MADIFSKKKRSEVMGKIRSKNTIPERTVRSYLFARGYRFRLHQTGLPGNPDIVLRRYSTAIFVNGCFWHGHDCTIGSGNRKPKSNKKYWNAKIEKNVTRDKEVHGVLRRSGWKVVIVWECQTRDTDRLSRIIDRRLGKQNSQ